MRFQWLVKTSIISLVAGACCTSASGQERKAILTINNVFIDRVAEWKHDKKMDFGQLSSSASKIALSGNKLTINNTKYDRQFAFRQPTNAHYEQECWAYSNAKVGLLAKGLSDDLSKASGLGIERRLDASTVRSGRNPELNGAMDGQSRSFYFLVNGKGDVRIYSMGEKDHRERSLFNAIAVRNFLPTLPNHLVIDRDGLKWNFYLNDELLFTYNDNSFGNLSNIYFVVAPGAKASFESPSITYFEKGAVPYERSTTGSSVVYKDNVYGFKVIESNIEEQCPTAQLNNESVRYYSIPCYKENVPLRFGIIVLKNGEKDGNPLTEFMQTYLKELYGENFDEEEFKRRRAIAAASKPNESVLVGQMKDAFKKDYEDATNIQFSTVADMTVGNNPGRFFDATFEHEGKTLVQRKFFTYTPRGLMIIQFDAPAGGLVRNKIYDQIKENIFSF